MTLDASNYITWHQISRRSILYSQASTWITVDKYIATILFCLQYFDRYDVHTSVKEMSLNLKLEPKRSTTPMKIHTSTQNTRDNRLR